ncbi:DDE-type integrase/transposase/recombinase [Zoogloea sp.]|uniref:DDE-type integrase/transposase/recombinase n=1 Tax=Zoogloea sp. TaxID=49181 RepID=UPI0035B47681
MQHHRGRAIDPSRRAPRRHQAQGPNQIWVWDITWLPGPVAGTYYYLYLMLDLFSRKVVGWEVFAQENSACAVMMVSMVEYKVELICRAARALTVGSLT